MIRRGTVAAALLVLSLAALIAGCGGSSSPRFPKVLQLGGADVSPTIVNSTLAIGDNRVSMTIVDKDDNKILDAAMHVSYYNLNNNKETLRSESDARFVPIEQSFVDEQSGGKTTQTGNDGVYVTHVNFDQPGDWGAEITITRDGKQLKPVPFRFNVLDAPVEPAIGAPAPPSVQMTLRNVANIEDIDSSSPPRPAMHDMTIAEAVGSGKPSVIAFATPALCRSHTCAPVMDTVMDPLAAKYAGRVNFIHVEPYVLSDLRQANVQNAVSATREWHLMTEPWVFVVDANGRIAGKFEGIVAEDEVESVLAATLGATPAGTPPAARTASP